MKSHSRITFSLAAMVLLGGGLLFSQSAYSQKDKDNEKKIHIKIITVKDGEEIKIDTTFNGDDFDNEAFRKEMKEKFGIELDNIERAEGSEVIVKVKPDKAGAVGLESGDETRKVIYIKEMEKGGEKNLEFTLEEEAEGIDTSGHPKKMYFISSDGEKFTIKEGSGDEKVIWVTEEGETKVIKGEGGEKVIIIKSGDDKCGKDKKGKKSKEETIKVIVITGDDDDDD